MAIHAGVALLWMASSLTALDLPLYVFDNGTGRGEVPLKDQADLVKRTGYAGMLFAGTKNVPELQGLLQQRGLRLLALYTGMNLSDAKPGFDPGLPEAIQQLKGSGTLIAFNVSGKAPNGDDLAVPVIREVADLAAAAGLKVALYPHYDFHMARIEDALRLKEKVGRPNVGIVFNLCHWLRSGDEANLDMRIDQALSSTLMVLINGSDHTGDWTTLIQTLDRGDYDVQAFVTRWRTKGYTGPFGLQCYSIKGDREANLRRSMTAWQVF